MTSCVEVTLWTADPDEASAKGLAGLTLDIPQLDPERWWIQASFQFGFNSDNNEVTTRVELSVLDGGGEDAQPIIALSIEPRGFYQRLELKRSGLPSMEAWAEIPFNRFLPNWEMPGRRSKDVAQGRYQIYSLFRLFFRPVLEIIEADLYRHLLYLGPLRDKPRRVYYCSDPPARNRRVWGKDRRTIGTELDEAGLVCESPRVFKELCGPLARALSPSDETG